MMKFLKIFVDIKIRFYSNSNYFNVSRIESKNDDSLFNYRVIDIYYFFYYLFNNTSTKKLQMWYSYLKVIFLNNL